MTATGWWQLGQLWMLLGVWPLPYPATYGSYGCVTAFAVTAGSTSVRACAVLVVLTVLSLAVVVLVSLP